MAYYLGLAVGKALGDVVITRDEIRGLMDGLLYVESQPLGEVALTAWATEHRSVLGIRYASELARHRPRGAT